MTRDHHILEADALADLELALQQQVDSLLVITLTEDDLILRADLLPYCFRDFRQHFIGIGCEHG
ncbi:MAG: hypothetical protein RIC84_11060 [Aggregatilineales bacterium]